MNNEQDLLSELIDSCRNAEDLRLPELQPLSAALQTDPSIDRRFKKSQQIDSLVSQSLREVPVPLGLEQRILSALEANQSTAESTAESAADAENAIASASRPAAIQGADSPNANSAPGAVSVGSLERTRFRKPNRRKVLFAALSTVAALAVVAFVAFYESAPKLETEQQVAVEASLWLNSLRPQWLPRSYPDNNFPMPPNLRLPNRYGWQHASASHPSLKVVCYNLSSNAPTLLFVCQGANPVRLPNSPSVAPTRVNSDWQVGSWKVGKAVYAIAVKGTPQQYKVVVRPNSRIASVLLKRPGIFLITVTAFHGTRFSQAPLIFFTSITEFAK